MCICALILTLTLVFTPRPHVLLRRVLCLCHGIVQTREGRPVLDPAMSNFDTLGRGWAWGLVALAILLGKTPANTKHQTYQQHQCHRMLHYATSRHAMLCHFMPFCAWNSMQKAVR